MGSSKKHKKHKDRKYEESSNSEKGPLKLVLKVGSSSSTGISTNTFNPAVFTGLSTATSTLNQSQISMSPSTMAFSQTIKKESELKTVVTQEVSDNNESAPPRLTLAYEQTGEISIHQSSSSSMKKLKKKKSKKKHRKHSHHHHHHHHRHHRGSCSHHSKSSSSISQSGHHDASKLGSPTSTVGQTVLNIPLENTSLIDTISAVPKSPQRTFGKNSQKSKFQQFLSHILKQLQRRDPQEFFAWPVTDLIAPGYSSIISRPMDFSTIKKKVEQNLYENITKFKHDIKLMCDNAMSYNRSDTIYHKAARKLWRYAKDKIFNRDSLNELLKPFSGINIYSTEIGYNLNSSSAMHSEPMKIDSSEFKDMIIDQPQQSSHQFQHNYQLTPCLTEDNFQQNNVSQMNSGVFISEETFDESNDNQIKFIDDEEMTAEKILEQAQKAAQSAVDRLTLERPNGSHLSFFRQRDDGSTTLNIIGSASGNMENEERFVTLADITGKLSDGLPYLNTFTELDKNMVKPIDMLPASPFCSYLPTLNSNNSNLTIEETNLLRSTYGEDELGLQYVESLLRFSNDSDYVLNMADSLLDVLTHGAHSKVLSKLREDGDKSSKPKDKNQLLIEKILAEDDDSDDDNNQTHKMQINNDVNEKFNETSSLINKLENVQNRRLSSSNQLVKPSKVETKIAIKLVNKLSELISTYTTPADVVDTKSIRKAMGVHVKE